MIQRGIDLYLHMYNTDINDITLAIIAINFLWCLKQIFAATSNPLEKCQY